MHSLHKSTQLVSLKKLAKLRTFMRKAFPLSLGLLSQRRRRQRKMQSGVWTPTSPLPPLLPPTPDLACKSEALALCADAVGRELHQCLGENIGKLSKVCKGALRPYVTELVRKSCSADAQIECSGVGQADVVTCLLQTESTTSIPCRAALALWPRAFRAAAGATNPTKNAAAAKGAAQ